MWPPGGHFISPSIHVEVGKIHHFNSPQMHARIAISYPMQLKLEKNYGEKLQLFQRARVRETHNNSVFVFDTI